LQVIYLAPFVLLSAILGVIFLMVPRLRRHAVSAAVVPVAFAVSSITGVFATVLIADHFGFDRAFGFDEPADSLGRIATFFSIYTRIPPLLLLSRAITDACCYFCYNGGPCQESLAAGSGGAPQASSPVRRAPSITSSRFVSLMATWRF
jgi:hypothetical protein